MLSRDRKLHSVETHLSCLINENALDKGFVFKCWVRLGGLFPFVKQVPEMTALYEEAIRKYRECPELDVEDDS